MSFLKRIPRSSLMPVPLNLAKGKRPLHSSAQQKQKQKQSQPNMLQYSNDLPSLPVPDLHHTATTYLQSIRPFVKNDAQYNAIKAKLDDFIKPGGIGHTLQQRLHQRAASTDNWISQWWDEDSYLAYRDPVVPYVSYFFSHAHNLLPSNLEKSQLKKATLLIDKILDFKALIAAQTFPPELVKDTPYCMNGFTLMFNNSRIPGKDVDDTIKFSQTDLENQFLVVIKNNRFYKLYHHDSSGKKLDHYQIYTALIKISEDANAKNGSTNFKQPPVGVLTTLNRDQWYEAYTKLHNYSIVNANAFDDIFRSSFVLTLDDVSPESFEERSRNCWHGNGTNRYFDKPLQFFVAANGASGFLGEHSKMDGTPNLTLNNYLGHELSKFTQHDLFDKLAPTSATVLEQPHEIKFDIPEEVAAAITNAKLQFDNTVNSHELKVWRYQGYGKNLIKQFKTSPDAFIQILIQLAYFKYTGHLKPTYESATTRKFKFGRTETNRTVSQEVAHFVQTFQDPQASTEAKISAFRAAIAQQNKYIKLASNGIAVDRHIYGLKKSLLPNEPVPAFLADPMTNYSKTWYLSTSQLSSEYFDGYGWSQVHDLGLGLAYMINRDWLNVNIVAKKGNSAGLRPEALAYYLTVAADELKTVLGSELKAKL